jgi:hypothetical protein
MAALAVSIILWSMPVEGEEDEVLILAYIPEEPITDVVYKGERCVVLSIFFGQNCTDWSWDIQDPLFITHPLTITKERVEAGKGRIYAIDIDPGAAIGTYDFTVYLNYTTEGGDLVNNEYDFTLHMKKSLEMVDVHVTDGRDHKLWVSFETFQPFSNVTVVFDGDGDVGIADERIVLENVEVGVHKVSTTVFQDPEGWSAQEVGWAVTGVVDNRTIEKGEYNIDVDVNWGPMPGFDGPVLLMAAVFALILVRRRR